MSESARLERLLRRLDPTALYILDSSQVSLYFLSELGVADRWIKRFQDATVFVYSATVKGDTKHRFAIINNQRSQLPSVRIFQKRLFCRKSTTKNPLQIESDFSLPKI